MSDELPPLTGEDKANPLRYWQRRMEEEWALRKQAEADLAAARAGTERLRELLSRALSVMDTEGVADGGTGDEIRTTLAASPAAPSPESATRLREMLVRASEREKGEEAKQ